MHGDRTGIRIKTDSQGAIVFNIVISMACGAIFLCCYISDSDISAASIGMRTISRRCMGCLIMVMKNLHVKQQINWHGRWPKGSWGSLYSTNTKAKKRHGCKESTAENSIDPGGWVFIDLSKGTFSKSDGTECNRREVLGKCHEWDHWIEVVWLMCIKKRNDCTFVWVYAYYQVNQYSNQESVARSCRWECPVGKDGWGLTRRYCNKWTLSLPLMAPLDTTIWQFFSVEI